MNDARGHLSLDHSTRDAILAASLKPAPGKTLHTDAMVWRWLPWLLALSGARAIDILQARGEDFLHVLPFGDQELPLFEARSTTSAKAMPFVLHQRLVDMGLLEIAREHRGDHLFIQNTEIKEAERALRRYGAKLKRVGLIGADDGHFVRGFRLLLQSELRRAGVSSDITNVVMGRAVEPSKFDNGISSSIAAARALSRVTLPAFG